MVWRVHTALHAPASVASGACVCVCVCVRARVCAHVCACASAFPSVILSSEEDD